MTPSARRTERIRSVLQHRQPDLTVVMENIHDPHNVSAILRSCDAVGVLGVELLYTVENFPKIGKKSSSSANKWLERRKHTSVSDCFSLLHREGYRILATRAEATSLSLYECDLTLPTAFVFGNEHRGVSDEAAGQADLSVHIPMVGMIESLNVSVAAAVCLYEAFRQRMIRGGYERNRLVADRFSALFEDWIKR